MKKAIALLLAAMIVSCGKCEPTEKTTASRSTETVASLEANPGRLKELRQQCKTDRAKLGNELCIRVAEATNRRFFGDGKTPYTPPEESTDF